MPYFGWLEGFLNGLGTNWPTIFQENSCYLGSKEAQQEQLLLNSKGAAGGQPRVDVIRCSNGASH